jgi:hypothetical protein
MNHVLILSLVSIFVFILFAVPAALLLTMFDWIADRGEEVKRASILIQFGFRDKLQRRRCGT